ncbi:MAG TPA: DNA polymerase III subunit alpha [Bacteroidetes bacterium]|nr:MAG: DNA polymerase III subunit alpha [Ignavibacteria bacterium GWA2_54_16]HCA78851.1 DNA polymerase III subunit alpha [Bacteroidota bacterium]
MSEFIHLHNHSHYSLLDGAATVESLIGAAVQNKMPSVALTDHGVLFGSLEFYKKAKKAGIKPIVGCEAYIVTRGSRFDKSLQSEKSNQGQGRGIYHHILLLAKDLTGYKNLIKLVTLGHTEGYYYKPRIDVEILQQYKEGLVVTSACPGGIVGSQLVNGSYEEAREVAGIYKDIFGDDFYIEIQNHGIEVEKAILSQAPKIAKELGLKIVGTNDCHYVKAQHAMSHNIMLCIPDATSTYVPDYKTLRYGTDQLYFKSSAEMARAFREHPEAMTSTLEIAEKCNLTLDLKTNHMPQFPIPPEADAASLEDYLDKLSREGLKRRYDSVTPEIISRLEHELGVIKRMGYAGYFLIVQDFINAARERGIRVGPGRGSAAGSIVSYALGITDVDPLHFDLLFERFLNPDRVSMPDIDVDFADDKRDQVISYVKQKYGENSVSQIITFGTLSTRAVLKDVGRVLGVPLSTIEPLTKQIPVVLGKVTPLAEALESVPELRAVKETGDEKIKLMIETGLVLEGMNRNVSTHAAGIVIAPGEISDYVPMYKTPQTDLMTQYNMKDLEEAGLLKMDFLGLRTLTVIDNALRQIKENHGVTIDLDRIPVDDQKTLDLFCNGHTVAVFQFESSGMTDYLRKLKPTSIHDLVAMNALYRPGPMENIPDFIDRKHGRKKIEYIHARLEPVLKETYGVIVYQEQVMKIASEIGGLSLAQADLLRRAMGKKDKVLMAKQKKEFVEGAIRNGVDRKIAGDIFDLIEKFASYGFNKSHSVAYSVLAYQTAYLKAHYPAEYMAATLTSEISDTVKIVGLIEDCRKLGIGVLPPDVNESDVTFVVKPKGIRFGLSAIKNVGIGAMEAMVRARAAATPFSDIFDFCGRVDLHLVNKKTLESLIQAGALDSLHENRAQLYEGVEKALMHGQNVQEHSGKGQSNLFDSSTAKVDMRPALPGAVPWKETEILAREKAVLGFYLSGHPLDRFREEIEAFANVKLGAASAVKPNSTVRACGIVAGLRRKIDKKGNTMAFVTLEDFTGKADCIVFSDAYQKYTKALVPDSMVMVVGKGEPAGDLLKILVNEVIPMESVRERYTKSVTLNLNLDVVSEDTVQQLRGIMERNRGKCPCYINVSGGGFAKKFVYLVRNVTVDPNPQFIGLVKQLLGPSSIRLQG